MLFSWSLRIYLAIVPGRELRGPWRVGRIDFYGSMIIWSRSKEARIFNSIRVQS